MTTAVQHRRGTTAEHSTFTGLEGEVTIDTTKDTAVIHDGVLAGGYPLAKENLANVTTSGLSSIDGASTASDDKFFIYDQSATTLKTITRAELNNAIEQDALANVTITGGTINGTAIGGTTAAAGAFTTLSATGALTYGGVTLSNAVTGTGNMVLSNSPTLVTPALGTPASATLTNATGLPISTGVSGLGTGIATALAVNVGSAGAPVINGGALGTPSSGTVTNLTGTASININGTVGATTANTGAFTTLTTSSTVTHNGGTANGVAYLNGSKVLTTGSALTFDGSVVGITGGTGIQLKMYNSGLTGTQASSIGVGKSETSGNTVFLGWANNNGSSYGYLGTYGGGSPLVLQPDGGNLGLGVTPSAWGTFKALQISYMGIAASGSGSGDASISWNAYNNGTNWIYGYTGGKAARYKLDEGTHSWYVTATNGTAGNAISFTQAMTLDASGRLGIGTTSPAALVDVRNGYASGGGIIRLGTTGDGIVIDGALGSVDFFNSDSDANKVAAQVAGKSGGLYGGGGYLTFSSSEFGGSLTERARIDSSGNLLVGTTSGSTNIFFRSGDTSNPAFIVRNGNTSGNTFGINANFNGSAPNNTTSFFLQCNDTGAERATIRSNGGLANYQGNNVNLSDRREKKDFAPAGSYLDKICAIPVQTFNYIDQSEDDPGLTLGVVAQDVQAVAPELVMESDWSADKDGSKMRLSIYQTDLQYALMKALQELKAEFDAYKATHP